MKREDTALEKRSRGYNCAQSVACTYCEDFDLSEAEMFRITEGLGTGLGCTYGTCGALAAACILCGMKKSTVNLQKPDSKASTYITTREIVKEFREQAGAVSCRDIKGIETGKVLCECADCVRIACRLVEKYVEEDA